MDSGIVVYFGAWCADCKRSMKVLDSYELRYKAINVESDPSIPDFIRAHSEGMLSIPLIMFPDGTHLVEPSNRVLVEKLQELNLI